ncbi:MAG: biopolymer transporter ExbD [Prevotella sp.]|nr:biopolymer transporter ExbD [Prevotella sp.]
MIKRRIHSVPELNTTSTADISFMLLIFFLVASSVSVDKGLARVLPPVDDETEQVVAQVERSKALAIEITADGRCLVDENEIDANTLHTIASKFIQQQGSDHVIVVESSPEAQYDIYFTVQNQLANAYREARRQMAQATYGKPYDELNESQRQSIREKCPQHIAEPLAVPSTESKTASAHD